MTNNYEKAMQLVDRGIAMRHYTFKGTGYIVLDLGGSYVGYISPKNEYVDVAQNNVHVAYGDIDLNRMMIYDASHRPDYDRHIVIK